MQKGRRPQRKSFAFMVLLWKNYHDREGFELSIDN